MIGISPAELNMMSTDFIDLLNGGDACAITLSWETGTPDPVYAGKWVGAAVTHTQDLRGMVVFGAAYRIDTGHVRNHLFKKKFAEVPDADIAIVIPASVDLTGLVNVSFDIAGLGVYRPLEKPAEDVSQYAVMYPSAQAMVQWIFCKTAK